MRQEIPDKNIFMMCEKLNESAISELPAGYHIRTCRKDELDIWKAFHFDTIEEFKENEAFMTQYFSDVYAKNEDLFYQKCVFICDESFITDGTATPIATCFIWKSYGSINTIHWLKTLKGYEGKGLGRALLSVLMKNLPSEEYPIYLHTQPASYRAIKLYSDFGFALLSDETIGYRHNDLQECLPILKEYMPQKDFENLKITTAPKDFLAAVKTSKINQF